MIGCQDAASFRITICEAPVEAVSSGSAKGGIGATGATAGRARCATRGAHCDM